MAREPILIVDDSTSSRKLTQVILQTEGYDVRTAADAEEALQLLETFHPTVVLTDVRLPGQDGLELTRRIKSQPATRDIVVLALTACAMKGDKERMQAAGCDGYVTKPFDIEALKKLVAGHLSTKGAKP